MQTNQRLQIVVCSLSLAILSTPVLARPSPYQSQYGAYGIPDDRYANFDAPRRSYAIGDGSGRRLRPWRTRYYRAVRHERAYHHRRWTEPRRAAQRPSAKTRLTRGAERAAARPASARQAKKLARAGMTSREGARVVRRKSASRGPVASKSAGASSPLVAEARRYLGTNPTGMRRLWCARFMNMVLTRTGHRGSGSDLARSFVQYGRRIRGPAVGAIAVVARGPIGGHVGVISGIDKRGNPILVSGNHGRRVAEASYPRHRIIAYVQPVPKAEAGHAAREIRKVIAADARVRKLVPQPGDIAVAHGLAGAAAMQPVLDLPHWTRIAAAVGDTPSHGTESAAVIDLPRWAEHGAQEATQ